MPPEIIPDDVDMQSEASENEVPAKAPVTIDQDEEDVGDSDAPPEDEYLVEKILGHKPLKKGFKYQVKWEGYDDPSDITWESEDNLVGAAELVEEYWTSVGGRPGSGSKPGRKRKHTSLPAPTSAEATSSNKRSRHSMATTAQNGDGPAEKVESRKMPQGDWEGIIAEVETLEVEPDAKTGKDVLYGMVSYADGLEPYKGRIQMDKLRRKCPQKVISYLLSHLVFKSDAQDEKSNGTKTESGS